MLVDGEIFIEPDVGLVMPLLEQEWPSAQWQSDSIARR